MMNTAVSPDSPHATFEELTVQLEYFDYLVLDNIRIEPL